MEIEIEIEMEKEISDDKQHKETRREVKEKKMRRHKNLGRQNL